mgnify:CR=1 FL=1
MSAIIDLIELIKLRVNVYHNARVCGHWKIKQHSEGNTCFHMATQGRCLLSVPGHGEWTLSEGDLVIFPREIPHTMEPIEALQGAQQHLLIADSQDIAGTSMLCGEMCFLHCGNQPLLNGLPAVFVIERTEQTSWLSNLFNLIVTESLSSRKNTNPMLNRLCELLFSYAIRHFIESNECHMGVPALFAHPQIAKAVAAIHTKPAHAWGLINLAEHAGMSRTQFAHAFKNTSGWTPIQYLSWWRMQLAWSYLHAGERVASVADSVGYQSEAAFSRAFRKHFNESAGTVRRANLP